MAAEPAFSLDQFAAKLDFVVPQATLPTLAAATKGDALREMIDALTRAGALAADVRNDLLAALLKREQLGSTGIGNAVAVPHVKFPGIERVVGNVAWSPGGIDFAAVDRQPVHFLILILCPANHGGAYLRALETVSRLLRELPRPLARQPAATAS